VTGLFIKELSEHINFTDLKHQKNQTSHHCVQAVFLKLWSTVFRLVGRGGPQAVSEEKALQKLPRPCRGSKLDLSVAQPVARHYTK
jgi:hypothetical protein